MIAMTTINPGIWIIIGGVFVPCLPARVRYPACVLLPLAVLGLIGCLDRGVWGRLHFLDYELTTLRVDGLSILFGVLFAIAAALSSLFAWRVQSRLEAAAALVYSGSAMAAAFAGDLITLFVFWEISAVASVFLIWARGSQRAYRSGLRYLMVQVVSGLLLLTGTVLYERSTGSISFDRIGLNSAAAVLIFLACGIKCAFPLLHNWLEDAYPEATVGGTVWLSAFTTKLGIYALARGFPGTEPLTWIGVAMTAFPIFYAVIENDLRRVLAYSTINQLGFMVAGIGIGTTLSVNGAVAHAFSDMLFKGLLFMSMGAVLHRTGTVKGSELGGLYKSMPWTTGCCIVGAMSISAFPLFSGFVSKGMILAAAMDQGLFAPWLILLFASAGVFHHAGIKIPFFAFFAHDAGWRVREAPWHMLVAMAIAAAGCVGIGLFPSLLYALLPDPVHFQAYTTEHVVSQLQLLLFSALAFTWLKVSGLYPPELPSVNLDFDVIYRKALPALVRGAVEVGGDFDRVVRGIGVRALTRGFEHVRLHCGPEGVLARSLAAGTMVIWVIVALATALAAYEFTR